MLRRSQAARGPWLAGGALFLGALCALGLFRQDQPSLQASGGSPTKGASRELERARLEQGLIRAEGTATMLHALRHAPLLPGGHP